MSRCRCFNCITPPHLLKKLLESNDARVREAALQTLVSTARLRGERSALAFASFASGQSRRTVFDCAGGTVLSKAAMARSEDGPPSTDTSVNRAFDGLGATRDFFKEVFDRESIDNRGMRLDGYVHRGERFNNAFWDGREMVFGDGDGVVFDDFTMSLDVIAHELMHGVTEFVAGLEYRNQSGALNESLSDVFGSLVKQWTLKQSAEQADWLIGAEIFTPSIEADALRSMKAPGTAYNNEHLGKDPQPAHMSRYVSLPDNEAGDNGGVHINSGIPNKAFYLTAIGIGGYAWEAPGRIWYEALASCRPDTDFQAFASETVATAGRLYGGASPEQQAVITAWKEVGIRVHTPRTARAAAVRTPAGAILAPNGHEARVDEDSNGLSRQMEVLSAQLAALSRDVAGLKGKGRQQ